MHVTRFCQLSALIASGSAGAVGASWVVGAFSHTAPAAIHSVSETLAEPTVTRSVDLQRLLAELHEAQAMRQQLDSRAVQLNDERTKREEAIDILGERAETLTGQARADVEAQRLVLAAELDGWIAAQMQLHEIKRRDQYLLIYDRILKAAAELAEASGYDRIVLDDTHLAPDPRAGVEEVAAQMFARRTLYASPAMDVTDELIARMNNAFAAGVGSDTQRP